MRPLPPLAAVAAALALLLAAPGPAHASAPFGFVGTNAEDIYGAIYNADVVYREQALTEMQASGITVLRQSFRWGYTELARGVFDWAQLDTLVLAAADHGMRVLPLLYGEPPWATSRPAGNEDGCTWPPKKTSDFTTWVRLVVQRYGRTGTFWHEHPEAAHQAITAYEIWNEPNFKPFWKCKPNAKEYVKFARPAADAIRKIDPHALIISAGSPKIEKHPGKYFRQAFKAGAAKVFNAVGLHPYQPTADAIMKDLRASRKALDKNGAKNWSIVITEYGWATTGPKAKGKTVSESKQAQLIRDSLLKMAKEREKLKIKSVIYYTWHDHPPAPGQNDFWGLHTGLLRPDDTPKPALDALAQAAKDAQ